MEFNTALLHKGFNGEKVFGSTLTPIYQVSAFSHSSAEQLEKVFNNRAPGYAYSRIGNPTVTSCVFVRYGSRYDGTPEHS